MNLVIMPVYKLAAWPTVYPWFQQMGQLCAQSFRRNLADVDDVLILHHQDRKIISFVEMFRDIFDQTHTLWKEGHNLFFTDADSLCVQPVKIFNQYTDFRLFSQCEGNRFSDDFPAYMLSGSRYLPCTMDEGLWDIGMEQWEREPNLPFKPPWGAHWDFEQYVYNHMFFSQPGIRENWEAHIRDEFNLFYGWEDQVDNATILSFNTSHSWRGNSKMTMEKRLQLMKDRMPELEEPKPEN